MDRGWYVRFVFVLSSVVGAWFILWPSIDKWVPAPARVKTVIERRISPGLDIRGGLRLMYEVEVDEAVRDRRDLRSDQFVRELGQRFGVIKKDEIPTRDQLKQTTERVKVEPIGERGMRFTFKNPADAAKLDRDLVTKYGDVRETQRDASLIELDIRTDFLDQIRETAVEQARETISNRVDALGLREASVTAQNADIIVEVPGADEQAFQRMRDLISKTARLEFEIVDDDATFMADLTDLPEGITRHTETVSAGTSKPQVTVSYLAATGAGSRQKLSDYIESLKTSGKLPKDHKLLIGEYSRRADTEDDAAKPTQAGEEGWRTYYLLGRAEITGQAIEDAFVANDPQTSKPYVAINFNDEGAEVFRQLTAANVKRRMAIVLDDRVASDPVIQTEIGGGHCQITLGGFRPYNEVLNEAKDLVVVLKAGALPVPIRPSNEQMIGPTLGLDGVSQGVKGALAGIVLVLFFMAVYYEVGGLIADVAMIINLLLILASMAFFEATLTLPGVVALALNIGMAVDANVLITERIREELRNGKSPRAAVDQGFGRAFWSIFDSQLTTLLAGIVMFQFGTGPIKGFAVTLIIGICTSLFTGVYCSRVAFDWVVRGLRVQNLRVG
jgi:preprotein translocase subunit SecD